MLKKKKTLRALDSFHALCANKPTSSPQSTGTGLLRQPRAHHSSRISGWTKPWPSQRTARVLFAGGAGSSLGSIWSQRPPAPCQQPLPPSCLFCIKGSWSEKVNSLSSYRSSSPSPLPLKTALFMGEAAIRKSQSEGGQSTGPTKQGCRAQAKAAALRASPEPGSPAGCLPAPSGFPRLLPSGRATLHRR